MGRQSFSYEDEEGGHIPPAAEDHETPHYFNVRHSKKDSAVLQRMGVSRLNINNELDIEYRPIFCVFMIMANCLVFIYEMYKADFLFEPFDVNPTFGPGVEVLVELGAKDTQLILNGDWWRFITPVFLHGGVIHLALNMLMLWSLGSSLEEAFGFIKIASVYLISGFVGVVTSVLLLKDIVSVGASGAIYGLIGALYGDFLQNHKIMQEGKEMYLLSLILNTIIGLGIGLLPIIDNFAHIGGLLSGLLVSSILLTNTRRDQEGRRLTPCYSRVLTILSAILLASWIAASLYYIYNYDGQNFCSYCQNLNCVETPWWTCSQQCVETDANGQQTAVDCNAAH